jgi:basic amino acid/polyamine antiporter, APA family
VQASANRHRFGLISGILVVVSDTAGVGVLTTTGFMVKDLSPVQILVAWLIGGTLALCGALSYGALAKLIARSGGEYRYLSDLLHPAVGYIAGWTSFLLGFSAPVALAAYTAGAFTETFYPGFSPRITGAVLIGGVTLAHTFSSRSSMLSQNLLAVVKVLLLIGFVVVGLTRGTHEMPVWPHNEHIGVYASLSAFMVSLVYIAFSYSGWNSAVYAAEEFEQPERDVPRSMIFGTLIIIGLYLVVNYVFVTNLPAERMMRWSSGDTERVTLAHLMVEDWLSAAGADVMSGVIVVILVSSLSAMMLTGPRVYAAMARDGFLPAFFKPRDDQPPRAALAAQALIATIMLATQSFGSLLTNVGAILTASAALTAAAVFRVERKMPDLPPPTLVAKIAAAIYMVGSLGTLFFTLSKSLSTVISFVVACIALFVMYRVKHRSMKLKRDALKSAA